MTINKLVAFLVFVCKTASFIAQISSSENVLKGDAILAPVAKYSELQEPIKRAKIDIHWFGNF